MARSASRPAPSRTGVASNSTSPSGARKPTRRSCISTRASSQEGILIYGQRVPADGHATMSVCNYSGTTQAADHKPRRSAPSHTAKANGEGEALAIWRGRAGWARRPRRRVLCTRADRRQRRARPGAARWRGPESNRRHHDFQSCALPTELPRPRRVRLALVAAPVVACRARHQLLRGRRVRAVHTVEEGASTSAGERRDHPPVPRDPDPAVLRRPPAEAEVGAHPSASATAASGSEATLI